MIAMAYGKPVTMRRVGEDVDALVQRRWPSPW